MKASLNTKERRQKAIDDNGDNGSGLLVKSGKSKKKKGFNKGNNAGSGAGNDNDGSSKIATKTCYCCKK